MKYIRLKFQQLPSVIRNCFFLTSPKVLIMYSIHCTLCAYLYMLHDVCSGISILRMVKERSFLSFLPFFLLFWLCYTIAPLHIQFCSILCAQILLWAVEYVLNESERDGESERVSKKCTNRLHPNQ